MNIDMTRPTLGGARLVLAVTGSIAAYKAVGLLRALIREGAAVDVAMEDNQWADVHPPIISTLRAGDKLTTFAVRRAIEEAVSSGHAADAWVTVVQESNGVHVTVHVMPRKVIESNMVMGW